MIKALLLLLIIAAGFVAGPLLSGQTGYVLIAIAGFTIETSLVVLVLGLLLLIIVLWVLEWVIRKLSSGTKISLDWSRKRKAKKAKAQFRQALHHLLTANYEVAQKDAELAAKYDKNKEPALLVAAIAAELHHDVVSKQALLVKAAGDNPTEHLPLQVAEAQRAAPAAAVEQAKVLLQAYPEHVGVKRIAAEIFYQYEAGAALLGLIPELDKYELVSPEQLHVYMLLAFQHYFANSENIEALHQRWRQLPKKQRQRSVVRLSYIHALQRASHYQAAERVILKGLRKGVLTPAHLLRAPIKLTWQHHERVAEYLQEHVKQAVNDIDALALLAVILIEQGDYELAQRVVRSAIQIKPSSELYRILGDACLAGGKSQPALDAYREAVK